jgi:hypothetical protein
MQGMIALSVAVLTLLSSVGSSLASPIGSSLGSSVGDGASLIPLLLYVGPDQLLPLTSVLAAVLGVLLMVWRYVVGLALRFWQFVSGRVSRP